VPFLQVKALLANVLRLGFSKCYIFSSNSRSCTNQTVLERSRLLQSFGMRFRNIDIIFPCENDPSRFGQLSGAICHAIHVPSGVVYRVASPPYKQRPLCLAIIQHFDLSQSTCPDVAKEERVLERVAPSVTGRCSVITSRVSLSPPSGVWLGEVV